MVLTVARPDAFDEEGVRGEDVVFVVRRGWLNDMLSGPGCFTVLVSGRRLGLISPEDPHSCSAKIMSHKSSKEPDSEIRPN